MKIKYEYHSPTRCNLFAAAPAMWALEYIMGIPRPANVSMSRGTAVEAGVTHGLLKPTVSEATCSKVARAKYDELTVFSKDPRKGKYRDEIDDMVVRALSELRPYGVPSRTQTKIELKSSQLKLPFIGFLDFAWDDRGIVNDLKTTDKMPGEIRVSHARQVAFYTGDNMKGSVTYCTPKKCDTYALENAREHKQALVNIAKNIEFVLSQSDDPQFFINSTAPDIDNFYWKDPVARQLAWQYWGV